MIFYSVDYIKSIDTHWVPLILKIVFTIILKHSGKPETDRSLSLGIYKTKRK